ncbi:Anthocyanidin 3-O-glucosyltransferase [Actinidia chinensis var. chinensis]|uniref:Glycosyltransferase n=1 Tax=Actinidia chinensis var. chinensis TaxID=1590841 RepID=A0A2R6RED9_ACTCC|nr:Anthocyanidin 3-O-glucosyltransferase [Actinidia chinensis var. chinensis]
MQVPNEGHVAVLAFPFGTHAAPLLTLTRCLSSSAPNLRFSFLNSAKSNAKVFSKIKPDDYRNIKPCNVDNGIPEDHVFSGHPLEAVELFLRAMPRNFENELKEVVANTGTKITCLLTDSFFWFAADMAAEMGVPWVALWTASPCSVSVHMYTDVIRSTMKGIENGDQTLDFIPGMNTICAKDLPEGVIHGNLDAPFSQMLHKMGLAMPKATALAMNAFEEIDPTITKDLKSKLKMVLNVGPFDLASPPKSYSDDSGCIRWLDCHEPASVAYLSFGTILTPPPNELIALAQALEAQKVPFLWSLRDTSKLHLLEAFLQRTSTQGKVVPWTPQLQVLENSSVGVFITHAGWNSVSESIAGGVPMICRPFFADQMLNSRLVVDIWQIGASLEGGTFTKSGTMRALEIVFSSEKGKKMKENIGVLKAKAKMAVGENGSSTKNFKTLLKVVSGCEEIP